MVAIIVELSKYILIICMAAYTFSCFSVFATGYEKDKIRILTRQNVLMFLIQFIAYVVMYLATNEKKLILFYLAQVVLLLSILLLYGTIYPKVSRLIVNNMAMLLCVGFIMITRLTYQKAVRQFMFSVFGTIAALVMPVLIKKLKFLKNWRFVYAFLGIGALLLVALLARETEGAKLGFTFPALGISVQPSEFVKILFVFFLASSFSFSVSFKNLVFTTITAAAHVLLLVLSTDLGGALIFFVVYVVMLSVATRNICYTGLGIFSGAAASFAAYRLFPHVRIRVAAWKDPFASYDTGGYQVAQSLFAIGTGSWFGMGLFQGMPFLIPVAEKDFIFAALSEELGLLFGICLILICVSCYVMFLNIALRIHEGFYKFVALGLGTCYIFQVFLNVGGVTKFIPSTGVTLPLVSYGGSSLLSTMMMFGIVQGIYILREDEEERVEKKSGKGRRRRFPSGSEGGRGREEIKFEEVG